MEARVLIVDDHASFRSIARRLLDASGFAVVGEAADGVTAISAARRLRPDVVLLDIQLPDIDGFAVAEAIAAEAIAAATVPPTVPPAVVLVSSRSCADYGGRVGSSSALGFIAKSDLSGDAVRRLLGSRP